jgi:ABC-2 type transport system ATP-binding protein
MSTDSNETSGINDDLIVIKAKNISKVFTKTDYDWRHIFNWQKTDTTAVKNLNIEIKEGEFVGFLGPNGAGKTTFLKILSGIIHPTGGEAKVLGYTPWERDYKYLSQMAIVMGQKNQLWWDLPAIDSFNLLKEVYAIPDKMYKDNLDEMVEILDMKPLLTKQLRNMSLGERMKCELAASFLHSPKIIFLDEPTIGLDVVSSYAVRKFLKKINKEKKITMILTSHYMGDIEALCKRVVIINKGEKIYDGGLSELKEQYAPEKKIEIFLESLEEKQKFAKLSADNKKISENKGIIKAKKEVLSKVIEEVFAQFPPENISINDIDTEEVISKICQKK